MGGLTPSRSSMNSSELEHRHRGATARDGNGFGFGGARHRLATDGVVARLELHFDGCAGAFGSTVDGK